MERYISCQKPGYAVAYRLKRAFTGQNCKSFNLAKRPSWKLQSTSRDKTGQTWFLDKFQLSLGIDLTSDTK